MSNRYNVVFTGRILDEFSLDQVRANLSGLFKLTDPAVLDRIFSGKRVLLQKGLTADEAQSRLDALHAAGAACEITQDQPAATPASAQADGASATAAAAAPSIPARLELGGAPVKPLRSHHQLAMEQRAAERAAQNEPRFTVRQDAAVASLDERFAPWDPHFFPACARGLSWGGFLAPLLWGTFNGLRLSFLPALAMRFLRFWVPAWAWIIFYLAFGAYYMIYGREMAWTHKPWRNADHFIRIQRYWAFGGLAFFLLLMSGLGHFAFKQHEAKILSAATVQYETAIMAAGQLPDTDQRSEARAKARQTYLSAVNDPRQRSELQHQFHDVDAAEASGRAESTDGAPATSATGSDSTDHTPDSQ